MIYQSVELPQVDTGPFSFGRKKKAESGLLAFPDWLKVVSPTWIWNWNYQKLIQQHLQKITDGTCKRLMLFVPPRHGKSEMVTVRYPIYRLEQDPSNRIIIGAYNQTLAEKFSRKSRKLAQGRLTLSKDRQAVEDWETDVGGGLRAVGVGGGITGQGGNLIIIDDPVKSREEANSKTYRDKVYDWYTDDLYTRLEPGASIILIMTRWHEDDLAGRILRSEDGPNWEIIKLPAEAEANDPLGRAVGEALNPERYPVSELRKIQTVLKRSYWALYQQRPQEQEGDTFKRSWFEIVREVPAKAERVRYWDRASTKDGGDWTVGALVAKAAGIYYVEDIIRGQWSTGARDKQIKDVAESDRKKYGNVPIWLEQEPGSSGVDVIKGLITMLDGFSVSSDKVTGDKALRAEPLSSQAEVENVKIKRADWNEDLLDELTTFPNGLHDDQVDAVSGAYNKLQDGGTGAIDDLLGSMVMGIFDGLRNWLLSPLLSVMDADDRQRVMMTDKARAYRTGGQPETLKYDQAKGQANDNITLNYCGLAVDRSVSMLFGKGIDFDLGGDKESAEAKYIDAVMDANHEEILFHTLGLYGAEAGTFYLRIMPEGIIGKDGKIYPRLMAIDPEFMDIDTEPEDIEIVREYCMKYPIQGPDNKPAIRKIEFSHDENGINWQIVSSIEQQGGASLVTDVTAWPYDFPPIVHGKNLPSTGTQYGQPDITPDVMRLQDRINFTASNIAKIIRLYAHPMRVAKGVSKQEVVEVGPDKMLLIPAGADIQQLDALGDLPAAQTFYDKMTQGFNDVTRTVDITSLHDKLGALTNFGLRVLYQDSLQKLSTKRELYGDALEELVRRLLVMNGTTTTPDISIHWPEPLPQNEPDTVQGLAFDQGAGIVSQQTLSTKRGYDFTAEQKRIDEENTASFNRTPQL